jgi:hypothetical protein
MVKRRLLTRPPRACRDRLFSRGRYVEVLCDARTPLADFFTILLWAAQHRRPHDFYIGRRLEIK